VLFRSREIRSPVAAGKELTMFSSIKSHGVAAALAAVAATFALTPLAAPAQAAHRSFAQRHPIVTSAAAGMAAHHVANRHRRWHHRNVFQRHPVATGVGTAVATHHMLKKHH